LFSPSDFYIQRPDWTIAFQCDRRQDEEHVFTNQGRPLISNNLSARFHKIADKPGLNGEFTEPDSLLKN
jgi:hypothetical protein